MTKTTKIILASVLLAPLAIGGYGAYVYFDFIRGTIALHDRFPDLDRDLVTETSKQMWTRALKGDPALANLQSEEDGDKIFMEIYNSLK